MAPQTHLTRLAGAALLALAVLGPPQAAAEAAGTPSRGSVFGGKTSQNAPFVLTLRRGAVDRASLVADAKCVDGQWLRYFATLRFGGKTPSIIGARRHYFPANGIDKSGAFASDGVGFEEFGDESAAIIEKLKGRIKVGGGASGTYGATLNLFDQQGAKVTTCTTGTLRWTARSAKGRVFAGLTSQDQPVVVQLDSRRTKVTDLLIGWGAGCTPPGSYGLGEHLVDFPISRGVYGDIFADEVSLDDGGRRSFNYSLKGRVGATKATGRLTVSVKDTDGAGTTTATCRTGTITWSARTG